MAANNNAEAGDSLSLKGVIVPHTNVASGDSNPQQTKAPAKVSIDDSS